MFRALWLVLPVVSLAAQSNGNDLFESKIRPVLAEKCYGCHSSNLKKPMGGLVLDTKAGMRQVIVPGKPDESLLLRALHYTDTRLKMPPTGKLPDAVIADFEHWILAGAADPRVDAGTAVKGPRVVDEREIAKGRQWWAFQPLAAANSGANSGIDSWVLAKLHEHGLKPSEEADPRTLIRRAYLDLIGLKPTYAEIEAFANDSSPDRYEKLIDRLLASPHYGERWARYWLDIARYAEDNLGNITNPPYPHAWRYRDWVIEALNKDVTYDRFVKLQLAADVMPGTPRDDLRALGYLGLSPQEHKDGRLSMEVIGTLQFNDWDERVDAVSRGLLGMTVACARCHDHKFDPIPTRDYYRLEGVFASTQRATRPFFDIDPQTETRFMWVYQRIFDLSYTANLLENEPGSKPEQAARQVKKFREELAQLQAEVDAMGRKYPQIAAYMNSVPYPGDRVRKGRRIDPQAPFLNAVYDAGLWIDESEPDLTFMDYKAGIPRDVPVLRGGNIMTPGDPAPRGFPAVLSKGDSGFKIGSGRRELGERIFTDAAPLSARVIVNRVWGWHFDKPLVGTPSDFGTQGDKPTHPELLDDLAARFIANGWSLKWLHKEIMLSATYRQSSHPRADAQEIDPGNQWLWRMNPRRIDIEAYRDSILQCAGDLDTAMYGPSEDLDSGKRRTIYAKISRGRLSEVLRLYDVPQPVMHTPARILTISPLQALFVMNSPFMQEQAALLAKSVESEAQPGDKVRDLYRKILARDPNPKERDLGLSYLRQATIAQYAQALLSTNEVIGWGRATESGAKLTEGQAEREFHGGAVFSRFAAVSAWLGWPTC